MKIVTYKCDLCKKRMRNSSGSLHITTGVVIKTYYEHLCENCLRSITKYVSEITGKIKGENK